MRYVFHVSFITCLLFGVGGAITEQTFTLEHFYTGEYFSKLHGGLKKRNGGEYRGNFDLTINANSSSFGLRNNTTFFMYLENVHGSGITESYVGDLQVLSNIDADNFTQISEYLLAHSFSDDRLKIKIGKQDANVDFNVADNAVEFINSSFGIMPNIPLPTFPDPGLGIEAFYDVTEHFTVSGGIFDGNSNGRTWGFDTTFGSKRMSCSVIEVAYGSGLLYLCERRGALKLGIWRHGGTYDFIAKSTKKTENYGGYLIYEQGLIGGSATGRTCVDMFLQYGYADRDINEIPHYAGFGLRASCFILARPDDCMGIGMALALVNRELKNMKDETALEYYYQINLHDAIVIQPDIQYIINPGGINSNAVAAGMRVYVTF